LWCFESASACRTCIYTRPTKFLFSVSIATFILMRKDYMYPLRVWLTSAFLGTVLAHFATYINSYFSFIGTISYQYRTTGDLVSYFLTICLIALVASIPCWLTLWFVYSRLIRSNQEPKKAKWTLVIAGQVLCWGLFTLIALLDDDLNLMSQEEIVLPYALVVALSTWFYFPKRVSSPETNEI